MNTERINSALKKLDVIVLMSTGDKEVLSHAEGIRYSLETILDNGDLSDEFFSDLSSSSMSMLANFNKDTIEGIAAVEVADTVNECRQFFNDSNKPEIEKISGASVDDAEKEINDINTSLSFALSRLKSGRIDDLTINSINAVIEKHTPSLANIISSLVNDGADDYNGLIDQLEKLSVEYDSRGVVLEQIEKEKLTISGKLKQTLNELQIANDCTTSIRSELSKANGDLKELNALNPQRLKRQLAESKTKRASLNAEVTKLRKEEQSRNMALNFLRTQYSKLNANYSILSGLHNEIVKGMKLLTGTTLEGDLAYQRSNDSPDYAWVNVCYMQRVLSKEQCDLPVGHRIVNFPHYCYEVKTSLGVNVNVYLSEWGYINYQIIPGFTDWFGRNLDETLQDAFDACIQDDHPELWARFKYLRNVIVAEIPGIGEKTIKALAENNIFNAGQVGSNSPERLKQLTGLTLTECKKALSLCREAFDKWVSEHGELDIYSSRGTDSPDNVDKVQRQALVESTLKLEREYPELVKVIERSLPEIYIEDFDA